MNNSITHQSTKVDGINIHYLSAGNGATILLIHGWPTSAYLWRNIMPELSKKYRVIAIDLPGFGQSDKRLEDSFSFRYFNQILTGFLANLEIEKVTIGLHDLGGPIGLSWTVQNMDRVEKLIFFNTLVYPQFSWAVKLFGLASMVPGVKNWLTSPNGIKRAIYFGVHQKEQLNEEIIEQYQAPFKSPNSRKVLLKTVQRLSKKGFLEIEAKLPSFKGPVQIIYGENDKILPDVKQTMERVKKDLPQSNLISIPNCGHFLQEEAAPKISEVLIQFLKREVE